MLIQKLNILEFEDTLNFKATFINNYLFVHT